MLDVSVLKANMRLVVALSGGADSVALLRMLQQVQGEYGLFLYAAHFEHGIRGRDSLKDAAFVRALCEARGVPLMTESADVPALARQMGCGIEEAAREARHAFLRRCQREVGADAIALAHHGDDQAESVLMHILRGSGIGGLGGMRPSENGLIRPLLHLTKAEIYRYLSEMGQSWREDATNALADQPRNHVRLTVLPQAEAAYPGAKAALCRLAQIAREEDAYMGEQAGGLYKRLCAPLPHGVRLGLREPIPTALLRRVLKLALEGLGLEAGFFQVEALRKLISAPKGGLSLPGGAEAYRGNHSLILFRPEYAPPPVRMDFLPGQALEIAQMGILSSSPHPPAPLSGDPSSQVLDAKAISGACIRFRQPGDFIRPLGMAGRQSLKKYLMERAVPRPLRGMVPLLAVGSEVLWAVGVGISANAAISPKTDEAIKLVFTGEMFWAPDAQV